MFFSARRRSGVDLRGVSLLAVGFPGAHLSVLRRPLLGDVPSFW